MSGVVGVWAADDLDLPDIPPNPSDGPTSRNMSRPLLARDTVRYVGEPIAVVVASSARLAEDAAEKVWVELEDLPAVVTAESALNGTVTLFSGATSNIVSHSILEYGEESSLTPQVSVTVEVNSPRLAPVPIEPLAIVVSPHGDGIRAWCGHQAPHRLRDQLARFLTIPRERVRVTVPDVGGAFGMKGMLYPEYLVVAKLAMETDSRVAWIQTRREQFTGGTHGRSQHHRVTLEGDTRGRVSRARIEILADTGAYPHNGSLIPMFTRLVAPGLYDIPRLVVETTTVVTNRAPTGSYRGAGRPEAALAIERAMDAFARAAGIDPFQTRMVNLIEPSQLPHQTGTGALYDSGDYPAVLRAAMDLLDLPYWREEQARRLGTDENLIGIGVGAFVERAGGAAESGEYARVEISPEDHSIIIRTGSTDSGQGHSTVWSRLASDLFGVDDVVVIAGDTEDVAQGVGSFASRSAQIGASAVIRVAGAVLDLARTRAATRLEASVADLVYEAGVFSVVGSPDVGVSLWDLAEGDDLAAEEMYSPGAQTFPYGAHAAVVEVAPDTGEVVVLQIIAVDDCGTVLDPMIVEGQLHGSLAQGLGQALFEEVRYDANGQLLTGTLVDYLLPTALEIPPIVSGRLQNPAPSNPLGVKGAGEAGCIGLPPAILNAVIDALAPLGVSDLQLPLTPARVWASVQTARILAG
jgi:aerobic carbon-monoxide dehydrogenase large subunit